MKIKEWDGSGLPPVGTVCEYRLDEDSAWFKCKIMYVLSESDHCFIAWCDHLGSDQFLTFLSNSYDLQLRKIKTPEQIAAEDRLQAIDEMIELVAGDSSFNEVMSILYDAGYRKTEVNKLLTEDEQAVSNPAEAVVSCDFDHCKNEAVGMVFDTKEALGDNGCRNLKMHSKHSYCNQHMRESINYSESN